MSAEQIAKALKEAADRVHAITTVAIEEPVVRKSKPTPIRKKQVQRPLKSGPPGRQGPPGKPGTDLNAQVRMLRMADAEVAEIALDFETRSSEAKKSNPRLDVAKSRQLYNEYLVVFGELRAVWKRGEGTEEAFVAAYAEYNRALDATFTTVL